MHLKVYLWSDAYVKICGELCKVKMYISRNNKKYGDGHLLRWRFYLCLFKDTA